MSELFVTHIDSQEPEVLIVGDSGLVSVVAEVTQELNLIPRVAAAHPDTIAAALSARSEWYKIIWVVDATQPLPYLTDCLKALEKSQGQLIVAISLVSAIAARSSVWQKWQDLSTAQQGVFDQITTRLPRARVIAIQDWIQDQSWGLLLRTWLSTATGRAQLVDPAITLYPIDETKIKAILSRVLFHPTAPAQTLLRGQPVASSQVVQLLQAVYHRAHGLALMPVSDPVASLEFGETLSVLVAPGTIDIHQSLKNLIKHWPTPSQLSAPAAPPRPAPSVQSTPPAASRLARRDFTQVQPSQPVSQPKSSVIPLERPVATAVAPPLVVIDPVKTPILHKLPSEPSAEAELDQAVSALFSAYRGEHRQAQSLKKVISTQKISSRSNRRKKAFWASMVTSGLVLAALVVIGSYVATGWLILHNIDRVLTIDASKNTWLLTKTVSWLNWENQIFSAVVPPNLNQQSQSAIALAQQAGITRQTLAEWDHELTQSAVAFFNPSETTQPPSSGLAYQTLSKVQGLLKEIPQEQLTQSNQEAIKEYAKWVQTRMQQLVAAEQLQPHLKTYLGYDTKRTYAVVLQNEQELRPTGGFIQSVVLLTLDKGSIVNSEVMSSYVFDNAVTGLVKPPEEISTYLGETKWFLRDSNWDPDFPTSAQQMTWFIEKGTGKKIDGVVAVTVAGWQKLIASTGPVELPEFNETITDRNLAERLEYHSEIQFANLQEKPDYTSILWRRFWEQLTRISPEKASQVLAASNQNLLSQNMLIMMTDQAENQPLLSLGWSGAVVNPDCPVRLDAADCLVDTMAQVEANVGVNKANYYLKRSQSHQVAIEGQNIRHTRTLTLENEAQTNAWPKGTYKTFIRWYVPTESQLDSIEINGVALSPTSISTKQEHGKTVWGALVEVPIQSSSQVTLKYHRPLPYSKTFGYTFFDQKQPGVPELAPITVSYASPLQPDLLAPQAQVLPGKVAFEVKEGTHQLVGIRFK